MDVKFRSDKHRKAVFANLFGKSDSSKTKVSNSYVKNFETKTTQMKKSKLPKLKSEPVRFKDIKTKGEKVSCEMCKRKGLSLKKGKCKECVKETKSFEKERKRKIKNLKFERINEDQYEGGSLVGQLEINFDSLVNLFGEPETSDEWDKTDARWHLKFPNGTKVEIYNNKTGRNYLGPNAPPVEDLTDWHIGGDSFTGSRNREDADRKGEEIVKIVINHIKGRTGEPVTQMIFDPSVGPPDWYRRVIHE